MLERNVLIGDSICTLHDVGVMGIGGSAVTEEILVGIAVLIC